MVDVKKDDTDPEKNVHMPYKVFISHKVSEHGDAVKKFKKYIE